MTMRMIFSLASFLILSGMMFGLTPEMANAQGGYGFDISQGYYRNASFEDAVFFTSEDFTKKRGRVMWQDGTQINEMGKGKNQYPKYQGTPSRQMVQEKKQLKDGSSFGDGMKQQRNKNFNMNQGQFREASRTNHGTYGYNSGNSGQGQSNKYSYQHRYNHSSNNSGQGSNMNKYNYQHSYNHNWGSSNNRQGYSQNRGNGGMNQGKAQGKGKNRK